MNITGELEIGSCRDEDGEIKLTINTTFDHASTHIDKEDAEALVKQLTEVFGL